MPQPNSPSARPVRRLLQTQVVETTQLTPHLIQVVVSGPDLEGFPAGAFTDHYVKLQFAPPGAAYSAPFDPEQIKATLPREQWPRTRTYTVRAWDPGALRLTIEFVHHGDTGVAGPWAAAAKPGDVLQFVGPGGSYAPDPEADWHLFVGDESVIPAISASLQRIPAGTPAHVLLEVDGPGDELPLESPGDLTVTWVHRDGSNEEPLLKAVEALDFPDGSVQGFVHGEASSVRAVRRHLLVDRQVPREALSVSGYWKRERTEEGWREDKGAWNRDVEQDTA